MTPAVQVEGLRKSFGRTTALDGLDLTVEPGSVVGFLGPNGAGKSTTVRVLLGLLRADAGTVRLFGGDPWSDAVALHRRLAYVPGDVALWPTLTGGAVLDLLARLRGGPAPRQEGLVRRFELDLSQRVRSYSTGNRQKVALVAALSADVDLLVLDEPTRGLDPLMEEVFRECVREARDAGRSVLLSSHLLDEVEAVCDAVTIVRAGRTVASGTLAEMRHLTASTVTARVTGDPGGLAGRPGVTDLTVDGDRVTFLLDRTRLSEVLPQLAALGLTDLTVTPPSLEQLFLRHYS